MTDNKRLKRTIDIDLMDALMLARAAGIGANTAMMGQHSRAEKGLREYREKFMELVPEAARVFDGETWSEIGMAIDEARTIHVTLEPPRWRDNLWSGGHVVVTVTGAAAGDTPAPVWRFLTRDSDHKQGTPAVEAVHDVLAELAPMDCGLTFDAKEERRWGL